MAVGTIEFASAALERDVHYTVLLPDPARVGPGPYPVLVQLHGYTDTHTAWLHKSGIRRYVADIPLIVALPAGHNGWWANLNQHWRYEDLIVHDLWTHLPSLFPVRTGRWAIGGLSMGGFGALRIGMKHTDKFCSIYAHSSRIPAPDNDEFWERIEQTTRLDPQARTDLDCFRLADQIDRAHMPRISFDCGTDDFLIDDNRGFHAYLDRIGLPHHYAEFAGAHTWDYWDEHIREALQQHAEVLGIAAQA